MTEEKFNKKVSWTCGFCIALGIIMIISCVASFFSYGIALNTILALVYAILFFVCYNFTKKRKIAGPILGIVIGILYIIQLNIVSIIIGILIVVDCYSMVKYMKNIDQNKEEVVEPKDENIQK